jgi:hypothetical protein
MVKKVMRYLAFDLEVASSFPTDGDWRDHRPLGISCAAAYRSDGKVMTWYGVIGDAGGGERKPSMSFEDCRRIVYNLAMHHLAGYKIVTWNGLGFDFDVLAEECSAGLAGPLYKTAIRNMALASVDLGFLMVCQMGFMIGLESCAKGLGLEGKMNGLSGDLAPILWTGGGKTITDEQRQAIDVLNVNPGTKDAQELVLKYVQQDARTTGLVYEELIRQGEVTWTTRAGMRSKRAWAPRMGDDGLPIIVSDASDLPIPSYKGRPPLMDRNMFIEWTRDVEGQ